MADLTQVTSEHHQCVDGEWIVIAGYAAVAAFGKMLWRFEMI